MPGPKKLPKPENRLPELADGAATKMMEITHSAAELEREELLALGRSLGQMEVATFFGQMSDMAALAAYDNAKKSRGWKNLRMMNGDICPNFDAFCQERFGYSERHLRRISGNRELLGQEAFEQAEKIGLRQVDYNAIKALPAPDQELIRRATEEAQSRDEVLSLLQELAARHAKEKESLSKERDEATKKLSDAEANNEAKERLIADKDAKINSLTVAAGKKIVADTDWPDALIPLCDQIAAVKREIDHAFSKLETARIAVLQTEMPEDQRPKFEAALKHVAEVYASALASAERHYLKEQVVFAQTLGSFLDMDEM